MAEGAFSPAVKQVILARTMRRCDLCGLRVEGAAHFHHRLPRRMGGTSRPDLGLPSNGLLLHPRCHDWVEANPAYSRLSGLVLTASDSPEAIPVRLWSGWAWLNDDGTVEWAKRAGQVSEKAPEKRPEPSSAGESPSGEQEEPP